MMQTEGIRLELQELHQRDFGEGLTDDMWNLLVKLGHVAEVETGKKTVGALLDRVMDIMRAAGRQPERRLAKAGAIVQSQDLESHGAEMTEARAALLALEAETDEAVKDFRQVALKGKVLKLGQIAAWITEQAQQDGQASRFLTLLLPANVRLHVDPVTRRITSEPDCSVSQAGGGTALHRTFLEYPVEGYVNRVPTAAGRCLDQLRTLSVRLSEEYGWQPAQATAFVLTGGIPVVNQIFASTKFASRPPRIVLDIDATTPPRQVEAAYKRVRAPLLREKSRARRLSTSTMRLVLFVASRPQASWAQRQQAWNRQYPRDRKSAEANMRRDYAVARKALLYPFGTADQVQDLAFDQLVERRSPQPKRIKRKPQRKEKKR